MKHTNSKLSGFARTLSLIGLTGTCFLSLVQAAPPSGSGLYAIWSSKDSDWLTVPYLVGGQIVVQWADVEPEPGRYDFSTVTQQLSQLKKEGKKTTLQINGNDKPAWLFSKVPYYPKPLSDQVHDSQGTLMYWHPVYVKAYTGMIKAFAEFLARSPDNDAVIGIRQNFNAIGTEHLSVPKEAQDTAGWILPAGVAAGPAWSPAQAEDYRKALVAAYADNLSPLIRIFFRNSESSEDIENYDALIKNDRLGWFHTSSEAEPRSTLEESKYRRFYEDCRSGKAAGYAEPWASAWGDHGVKVDDRSCSPPQWNYWRLLLDLHDGVSYIAIYGNDLNVATKGEYQAKKKVLYSEARDHRGYQKEFDEAFRFAAKYAGYHASPEQSPGAWVAFRENHEVLADNAKGNRQLNFFNNDYNFLMERLPDAAKGVHNVGPENQRQGAWARVLAPGGKMELKLNDRFAASFTGGKVRVTFLDRKEDAGSAFQVICDSEQIVVPQNGTGSWQTVELPLPAGLLSADPAGGHISIAAGSTPVCLHMVEVLK